MPLRHFGYIELPPSRSDVGFDHADIHAASDRLYVAHTSNDTIDVIDVVHDRKRRRQSPSVKQPSRSVAPE